MAADWKFFLHNWSDRSYLGTIESGRAKTLSPAFNNAGAMSINLSLDDDMAYLIDLQSTYIIAQRDGLFCFAGLVWDTTETAESGIMNVSTVGFFQILEKRFTVEELTFTNETCGAICSKLLQHSELHHGSHGFIVGPTENAGFIIPKLIIPKDSNIAEWIRKLTAIENGIDFEYSPVDDRFHFYSHIGTDKPDVHFSYNVEGGLNNLESFSRRREGGRKVNKMKVISTLSNSFVIQKDDTDIAAKGTYMEIQTISGIRDEPVGSEAEALRAFAAAEVLLRKNPITTYSFKVKKPDAAEVFMPYEHFNTGDTGRLSVNKGALQVAEQTARFYGWTVSVDDVGNETLENITLSPS